MIGECLGCGAIFEKRSSRQKACSVQCGRKVMHARLMRERAKPRNCKQCGKQWMAFPKDKSKFCSWECHALDKGHSETKQVECECCGKSFMAQGARLALGHEKYCSKDCAYQMQRRRTAKTCENCLGEFEVVQSHDDARFCSKKCDEEYKWGERTSSWKGGRFVLNRGHVMVHIGRRKHIAEHRLVVSRALGRKLRSEEIVIHVDRDKTNNVIENLYLTSKQEWTKIQFGMEQWPALSNIKPLKFGCDITEHRKDKG